MKTKKTKNPRNIKNTKNTNSKKQPSGNWLKRAWKTAKDYVKTTAKEIRKNANKIIKQIKKDFLAVKDKRKFKPGNMIAFQYYAKDTTKTWDRNPLIICLGWSKKHPTTHFYGLNIHWLKGGMPERVAFASFFTELSLKRKGKLEYKDVKPFLKKYQGSPVLRMYIYKNVSGKVIEMPVDHFKTAAALPTEKWMGG